MKMLGSTVSEQENHHHNHNHNLNMAIERYDIPHHPMHPYDSSHSDLDSSSNMHDMSNQSQPSPCDMVEAGLCAGCGGKIVERYYLLAVDKQWHANCLKCSCCNVTLDSELTCFAKDGQIFCKEDYYRKFAVKSCARCNLGISSNELVMKARDCVYHLNCFSCVSCNKILATGEHFGMKGDLIFCKLHYDMASPDDYPNLGGMPQDIKDPSLTSSMPGFFPGPTLPDNHAPQKGRPRKRKNQQSHNNMGEPSHMDMLGMPPGRGMDDDGLGGLDGYHLGGQPPRQKRIRTSFKHHQLRILKSYFALNQNPDAKDLKQLAQKTGLTKRVLQVWFQNARAKYRRNLLRQEGGQDSSGKQSGLAQSPPSSGHDSSGASHGVPGDYPGDSASPPLTDLSSTPSLAEFHQGPGSGHIGVERGDVPMQQSPPHGQVTGGLSELFSSSINSMN